MSTQTFQHNGTTIMLTDRGEFTAVIGRQTLRAGSLAGIKSKIENAAKQEFKPFTALFQPWSDDVTTVTVIGVKAPRKSRGWRAKNEFVYTTPGEIGSKTRDSLKADTPENRKLLAEINAHNRETRRITDQRRKECDALEEKVKWLHADSFAPKRPEKES